MLRVLIRRQERDAGKKNRRCQPDLFNSKVAGSCFPPCSCESSCACPAPPCPAQPCPQLLAVVLCCTTWWPPFLGDISGKARLS